MKCPKCNFLVPDQRGKCPYCGFFIEVVSRPEPWINRNFGWLIPVIILGFLMIAAGAGFIGYRFLKSNLFHETPGETDDSGTQESENVPSSHARSGLPVEHGGIAKPEQLLGHGKLYFVPVGQQAIPAQALADYYLQKFGVQITVLPGIKAAPSSCEGVRKQCEAEEMESDMAVAYPEIARNPESVMIALTDEDIFSRKMGWDFTYSYHSARFGIVSSHRMGSSSPTEATHDAERLASMKQMLTKYVALLYFHVPESFDPTSIMVKRLVPNGGPDDLYESDLHAEDLVNGRRGSPLPCLFFSYSYETHKVKLDNPVLSSCWYHNPVTSTKDEIFETNLGLGSFTQRTMDLRLDSAPLIELRRGYTTYTVGSYAFGAGSNHSYNAWLASDGIASISYMDIYHEDESSSYFSRITPGQGFSPAAIYESSDDGMFGARMTWDSDHFKLTYRDGSTSSFLPCVEKNTQCYWFAYKDEKGNALHFNRGSHQELTQITASDQQGISFASDDQQHTIEAKATNGQVVTYEYDADGCLAKVHRADGQTTLYTYNVAHHMTKVAVIRKHGSPPETILTNEYDAQGRLAQQTLAGIGVFKIQYLASDEKYATEWKVTNPAGKVWSIISNSEDLYVVHTMPTRSSATSH